MATSTPTTIAVPVNWVDLYALTSGFASTAGVLIQNLSQTDAIWLFFGTTAPATPKDGMMLVPGESYYDKNGSAHAWVSSVTGNGSATLCKD